MGNMVIFAIKQTLLFNSNGYMCLSELIRAQDGLKTCPSGGNTGVWAQRWHYMCPPVPIQAQNWLKTCPSGGNIGVWAQNWLKTCPSAPVWAQNWPKTCPNECPNCQSGALALNIYSLASSSKYSMDLNVIPLLRLRPISQVRLVA